ncbi:DinB family protein [Flaviaesturariibacter amylovorans]|uniref:DinB family protein n=1 Tax=Flaviaesturariibacter amylovorans TaxID=1084520 RepID=A0ABP8GT48_9BACT
MATIDLDRVPAFYHRYIARAEAPTLAGTLALRHGVLPLLRALPAAKWDFAYAPGKWTIKELVQHLIDAERIFAYRALCFARGESAALPGFEEDDYVRTSEAGRRSPESILSELERLFASTDDLFASLSEEALERSGNANGNPIYVRAIGYIVSGHVLHHRAVLEERYLAVPVAG